LQPLWLNAEAIQLAERGAEAAGMPVAGFVESMLFEVCGARGGKPAGGRRKRERRPPGHVIQIGDARRRRGVAPWPPL